MDREFFIQEDPPEVWECQINAPPNAIHVIEYRAYHNLKSLLEITQKILKEYEEQDRLRKAIFEAKPKSINRFDL